MTAHKPIEQLRLEVERLGYRMVPPPLLVRQVVAYIRENGETTAADLANLFEINPTAASNRLRATALAGFLVERRRGRELVFELADGVAKFPWVPGAPEVTR